MKSQNENSHFETNPKGANSPLSCFLGGFFTIERAADRQRWRRSRHYFGRPFWGCAGRLRGWLR